MVIALQQPEAPVEKYLHPMDRPLMVMHALERKSQVPCNTNRDKWMKAHKDVFTKAGYDKIPPMHPIAARFVSEWPMPEREAQVLSYVCYCAQPKEDTVTVVDVSQSILRLPKQINKSPCVTPGAKMLLVNGNDFINCEDDALQSRPLLGPELLHLQGLNVFELATSARCDRFSHMDMAKLAGNAFCGCQLGVAVVVGLTILGEFLPETHSEYYSVLDLKDLMLKGDVDDIFDEVQVFIKLKNKKGVARARSSSGVALAC
jgi:hypothetical protein